MLREACNSRAQIKMIITFGKLHKGKGPLPCLFPSHRMPTRYHGVRFVAHISKWPNCSSPLLQTKRYLWVWDLAGCRGHGCLTRRSRQGCWQVGDGWDWSTVQSHFCPGWLGLPLHLVHLILHFLQADSQVINLCLQLPGTSQHQQSGPESSSNAGYNQRSMPQSSGPGEHPSGVPVKSTFDDAENLK